jgi:hypothetical protein
MIHVDLAQAGIEAFQWLIMAILNRAPPTQALPYEMRSETVLKTAGKWMAAEYSRAAPPHAPDVLVADEVAVKHFSALPVVFDGH